MNNLSSVLTSLIGKKSAKTLLKNLEAIGDPAYLLKISSFEEISNHVGENAAKKVIAALKLGQLVTSCSPRTAVLEPRVAYDLLRVHLPCRQEHVWAIYLDNQLQVLGTKLLNIGTATESLIDFREFFRWAIALNATSAMVAHNHPTERLEPSSADIEFTQSLIQAGRMMDIKIIDSLIIGSDDFLSLREKYTYLW